MKIEEHPKIPEVLVIEPTLHEDSRGFFMEIFREDQLRTHFVQGNHSHSRAGVLRGLHYHRKQSDAWYVISGEAQAMLVDLRFRKEKPEVGSIDLSGKDPRILFIPPGVAHGFLAITDVDLIYWVSHPYDSSDEFGISWDEPSVSAPWRLNEPVLSERDRNNPPLNWDSIDLSS